MAQSLPYVERTFDTTLTDAFQQNQVVHPDDLAQALADCRNRVVPPGFHVRADHGMLWYSSESGRFPGQQSTYAGSRSGTYIRDNFEAHGDTTAARMIGVATQTLNELQDFVSEESHFPWPGQTRPPRPHAEIRQSTLMLWFGDSSDPVLQCPPIPLPDIGR